MTRLYSTVGMALAGLALTVTPAVAGQRPRPSGTPSSGSAVTRGGGSPSASRPSSPSARPSSPSPSPSPSTMSSGSSSSPSASAPSRPMRIGGRARATAPERRVGTQDRAVPRTSGATARVPQSHAVAGRDNGPGDRPQAVPTWARPRQGRPVSGHAAGRTSPPPPRHGRGTDYYPGSYWDYYGFYGLGYYSPYYRPYYVPGYGLGLGFWYDPWATPYSYGSGYYGYRQHYSTFDQGSLRLKVKPRHAKVYVDGYFVGVVDSFDGIFQKLTLASGGHRVEVRSDGYAPLQFDVLVTTGETVTYEGRLERIR